MAAIDKRMNEIACPLEEKERQSVKRLYGMLNDIGDGDTDKGIRLVRNMFTFVASVQTKKTVVTGAIFAVFVLGLTGTAASFLWCAIKNAVMDLFGR